jgi:GNAT superfamily N-acetyltransferase
MKIYETFKNEFIISTDKSKLDVDTIHDYLCYESYWAKNIPVELIKKSIDGSHCFGLFVNEKSVYKQVGFARVISDCATFGYLADVFILDAYRGKGLSKWLMETIMNCPDLQGLRRWLLATKDAHGLYTKFGFLPLDKPERIMGFKPFEEYPQNNS